MTRTGVTADRLCPAATAGALLCAASTALAAPESPVTSGTAAFYAGAATLIGAFFLFNAAMKNRVGLLYAALFAVMLGFIWILEGGLFSVIPGLSETANRFAAMAAALLGCSLGFHTAGQAIDPQRAMKWARRLFRNAAVLSLILLLGVLFWPHGVMALAVDALLIAMIAAHLVAALTWRTLGGKPFRLPAIAALALLAAIVGLFLFQDHPSEPFSGDPILRWLFAVVALPAMAAIGLALLDLRRAHDRAMEDAVEAAHKDAEMSAALLEAEKNYSRARDTAARRGRQMATAQHDIRQPLAALRGELDALKGAVAVENTARLDQILDHFDALTGELAKPDTGAALTVEVAEAVPATLLFQTLARMFGAEAEAAGVELRFLPSAAVFHAPAVVLMRIASNLVANAIQHAGASRILIGVRPRGGRLRLDIIDDGAGFPPPGIDAALTSGVKGAESEGSGLGLSIVRELAEEQCFALNYRSVDGAGTAFSVTVPQAKPD